MLPHLNPDDYDKVAKAYQEIADERAGQFDRTFSRVDKTSRWIVWVVGSIVLATFAVGVWWNDLSTSRNVQQKSIDALKIETTSCKEGLQKSIDGFKAETAHFNGVLESTNQLIVSNRNERAGQIQTINDRLGNYDVFVEKYRRIVDNIEFMRLHGISFKEDFQQINKFPAPDIFPNQPPRK